MDNKLEMPLEQFAEDFAKENARLISGSGGIMEMKQTIADKEQEIERLTNIVELSHEFIRDALNLSEDKPLRFDYYANEIKSITKKLDILATILSRLTPETHPDTYFIHAGIGKKDQNGMPEKLLVVPAYGVDFSYVYEYTGKTTGTEW